MKNENLESKVIKSSNFIPPKDILEELYINQGKSTYKIGRIYLVYNTKVLEWLRNYGIPIRDTIKSHKTLYTGPSKDVLYELYVLKDMSTYKIGKQFNLAPTTVNKYLRNFGIKIRSRRNKRRIS